MPVTRPILPVVIRGPAILTYDSFSYYTEGDIKVAHRRPVMPVKADMWGVVDQRSKGYSAEISFTPAGEMKSIAKLYPYGPATHAGAAIASSIGNSIFGAAASPKALVILTKAGKTYTFHRAGVLRMPQLRLSPDKTLFGEMSFMAIGKYATAPSDAAAFRTLAAAAFADTNFDATLLKTQLYSAALGARSTPYDGMGARNGFTIDVALDTVEAEDVNFGIADVFVRSIEVRCSFAPNNLTDAQFEAIIMEQGSDVILPGDSVSKKDENLVITSDNLVVTLNDVGPSEAGENFGLGSDQNDTITFRSRVSFTTGAPASVWTTVIS